MQLAPRAVNLALTLLLITAAGGVPIDAPPTNLPTIEPTLPLQVDMRLVGVERAVGRARAQLQIELVAGGGVEAVELSIAPPEPLRITDGVPLPAGFSMAKGERRLLVLSVEGPDGPDLPIRLRGAFRTPDGRGFQFGHGVTLRTPRPGAGGRSSNGAWEVMAVPLAELRR